LGDNSTHQPSVASISLPDGNETIGVAIFSDPEQVFSDPYNGSKNIVYKCFESLVASGFTPLGVTNCLNFGNPEHDEVGEQLVKSIDGIAAACRELQIPVVSGNVSLYNEHGGTRVLPTPVIGMAGLARGGK
jgi:phosphoribosylformylglycinamidine synthase